MSVEQPPLADYPVQTTPGRFELLEAVTLYCFKNATNTDGRWLAVCKVRSVFKRRDGTTGSQEKVRIYRWQWREARKYDPNTQKSLGTGEYRWFGEERCTPSKKYWEKIKNAVDEYLSEIA